MKRSFFQRSSFWPLCQPALPSRGQPWDPEAVYSNCVSAPCLFVSCLNSNPVPAIAVSLGARPAFWPKPSGLDIYTWSRQHMPPATPERASAAMPPLSLPRTLLQSQRHQNPPPRGAAGLALAPVPSTNAEEPARSFGAQSRTWARWTLSRLH